MSTFLKRFQFSTTTSYLLEFGEFYLRFFRDGAPVLDGPDPYEITTQYAEADLFGLQFHQLNDVVYIAHPSYRPAKLIRTAETDWSLEPIEWTQPPFLDENATDTTITPSGVTGSITLEASDALFEAGHVGSYWRIGYRRDGDYRTLQINANGSSSSMEIFGAWELRTYGNWGATVKLERSTDDGATWETVRSFFGFVNANGVGSRNIVAEGTAAETALYRITVEDYSSATDAYAVLERPEHVVYGIVQITAVTDEDTATATVITELPDEDVATTRWAEGAWSALRGYPRAVGAHEQRMVWGGTSYLPGGFWGSASDDFENFAGGTLDSNSYFYELAGEETNAIQWIVSQTDLLIGTSGGEWRVRGDGNGNAITPSRVDAKQQSEYGSIYLQAIKAGDAVLFVERKGLKVRELIYNQDVDRFVASDLTLLAPHMTTGGVVQMAWQADRRVLWIITAEGALSALTYDREQQVYGWHRHVTQGDWRSVATLYGEADQTDEVWFVVSRTDDEVEMIEQMDPTLWTLKQDGFFVDSGLSYDGSPVGTFDGLDHLAGEEVVALVDGVVVTGLTVDVDGIVTLPDDLTGSVVHIGLAYDSEISPFRLDTDPGGVHMAKWKQVTGVTARLRDTVGVEFLLHGDAEDTEDEEWIPMEFPEGDDPDNPPLFSGDLPLDFKSGHSYNPRVVLRQTQPLPFILQGLLVDLDISNG